MQLEKLISNSGRYNLVRIKNKRIFAGRIAKVFKHK